MNFCRQGIVKENDETPVGQKANKASRDLGTR